MSSIALATTTRGRRTPGKPGRFDPSEPLHMTTRHGAAKRESGGTASTTGSNDDHCSRRGSLDDHRATISQVQSSPQARRMSNTASNNAVDVYASSNSQPPSGNKLARVRSRPEPAILQSASPSRKRKRTTPTPPNTPPRNASETIRATKDKFPTPTEAVFEIVTDHTTDEETDGTPSDDELEDDYMDAEQSTELTPAATPIGSRAMSSISETSAADLGFSRKLVDAADTKVLHVPMSEEVEDIEVEDMGEADEVDDCEGDEGDEDHAQVETRRRYTGRRRAEHQDVNVEAALRRQLQLKSAFRTITRSMKPLLAEIALKTTEALDADPQLHEKVCEYQGNEEHDGIQKQLDDAFTFRKAQIEAQLRWNKQNLRKAFEGEQIVRKSRCHLQIEDLREVQLDHLEHDFLVLARQARKSITESHYETEDEGGVVIPKQKGMRYRFIRTGTLDSKYSSRSRHAMECERAVEDLHARFEMSEAIRNHRVSTEAARNHAGFTVMDNAARDAANVRKDSIRIVNFLASAATEAERIARIPKIANEKAEKLQVLASLATRPALQPLPPSVRQDRPPPPPLGEAFQLQKTGPPQLSRRAASQLESPQHQRSPRDTLKPEHGDGAPPRPSHSPRHKAEPSRGDLAFLLSPPSGTFQKGESSPVVTKPAAPPASPPSDAVRPLLEPLPHQDILDALKRSAALSQRHELMQPVRSDPNDKSRENEGQLPAMESTTADPPATDREMHEFFSPRPLSIEGLSPQATESDPLLHNGQSRTPQDSLLSHPSLPTRPLPPPSEPPSSPGAPDSRVEANSPVDLPPETNLDAMLNKSRSRGSSVVSQSTSTEAIHDAHNVGVLDARNAKHKASKSMAAHKPSRTERHGLSRKAFKQHADRRKSNPESSEGKPQVMRFRLNTNETTRPASAQQKNTAVVAPQQHTEYYQPQPYGAWGGLPAPSSLPPRAPVPGPPYPYPYPGNYDAFHGWQYHSSFPGPPSSGSPWGHPFFPPPFGVPPPPPATGLPGPPDYWQQYYGGGAQRHTSQPPTHQPTPSTSGSQGQFGGPAIAPATDPRSVYGTGASPTHLPAFAQQRRHNDGTSTRRRAQSDHRDFKHYDPDRKHKRREM